MNFYNLNEFIQFNEERFTKVDMQKNRNSVTFLLNFLPGQTMKAHHHPGKEIYLLILAGTGTYSIDGEDLLATKGDMVYCEADNMLGFTNTGEENVTIYATMSKVNVIE